MPGVRIIPTEFKLRGALLRRQVGDGHVVLECAERRVLAAVRCDFKIRLEALGGPEGRGVRHEVEVGVVPGRVHGPRDGPQAGAQAPALRVRQLSYPRSPPPGATQTVPERGATTAKALAFASSQTNVSGASMSACTGQASPRACAAARRSAFGGTKPRATHCQ